MDISARLAILVLSFGLALSGSAAKAAQSCDFLFQPDEVLMTRDAFYRPAVPGGLDLGRTEKIEIYPTRVKIGAQEFAIPGVRKVITMGESSLVILIGAQPAVIQRNAYTGEWQDQTYAANFTGDLGIIWFKDTPFQVTADIFHYDRLFRVTATGVVDLGTFDYRVPYQNGIVRNWRGQSPITGIAVNFPGDTVTVHTELDGSQRFPLRAPLSRRARAYIQSGMGQAQ